MSDGAITWQTVVNGLKWMPLLGLAYVAISEDINADRDIAELQHDMKQIQKMLDNRAIVAFEKRMFIIERDIQDLQKALKQ